MLVQIKAGNNLYKLKSEIRHILYPLYQHNKITKTVYNNLIKSLNNGIQYDWDKDIDDNLKWEIELIIKSNESLAENKKKTRLENYC